MDKTATKPETSYNLCTDIISNTSNFETITVVCIAI